MARHGKVREVEPEVIITAGTSTFYDLTKLNERSTAAAGTELARVAQPPAVIAENPPAVPPISGEKQEEFKTNRIIAWIGGGVSIVVALIGLGTAALKVEPTPPQPPGPAHVIVIDCPSGEMGTIRSSNGGGTVVSCQRPDQPR